MADLKLVYVAPTEETVLNELELFEDKWDSKYPKIYKSWNDNLATMDITKKWTGQKQDWVQIHSQLEIYYEERLAGRNL